MANQNSIQAALGFTINGLAEKSPATSAHSFRSLLTDLGTVTRNTMAVTKAKDATFVLYPKLTPAQGRAFDLLGVAVNCCQ